MESLRSGRFSFGIQPEQVQVAGKSILKAMTGTKPPADRIGFMAMMLPLAAMALYALGMIPILAGFPMLGFVLMVVSILVLLLSIPINATLAFLSRRAHRQRFVQALVGLVTGILISVALFGAMRVAHLKRDALLQQLREAKAVGGSD